MSEAISRRGLRRHIEGWPAALWIVLVCALSAALVVPREVEPVSVPPPVIDRTEQRRYQEEQQRRAERAGAGLPIEVRSVGEAFRAFGRAVFADTGAGPQHRAQLRRLAEVAIERHGHDKLLDLRALQAELFARALKTLSGDEPALELRELGGGLLRFGLPRGWFALSKPVGDEELASAFRVYWADTLGLTRHPYLPTLNEWRVYYRFLLSVPVSEGPARDGDLQRKLGYVAALAKHDHEYPAQLAQGILLYQRGAHAESAAALRAHLDRSSDGRWALRARNYLAACGAALSE
jgi:hypothetical protein